MLNPLGIRVLARIFLALLVCLLPRIGLAGEDVVRFSLAVAPDAAVESVEVRATWLGEERVLKLEDPTGQGVYVGHLRGEPVRLLPVSVWARQPGFRHAVEVWAGIEVLEDGGGEVAWAYRDEGAPRAERLTRSMVGGPAVKAAEEGMFLAGALAWDVVMLLLVLGGLLLRRPLGRHPGLVWVERAWATPLILFVLAVVWTWPAALAADRFMVGRHFDLPGVVWSIDAAARLLPTLQDTATAWPLGADYGRFDSFTLLPLGWLLAAADPVTVHGWIQVLGVWLSGWAAAWFAEVLGARRPWGLLAGVVFAMSGLGANVLLEGHVFHVLNPWLPLFAGCWWRALGPDGRLHHGLLTGLFFALTLWTSAYLGLAAALVAIGFFLGALRREGPRPSSAAVGATIASVLLFCAPYLLVFAGAEGGGGGVATGARVTSANLASLAAATDEMDRTQNSQAFALPGLALALALLGARFCVRPIWVRRTLLWTAGIALLLSMGGAFGPDEHTTWVPLPLGVLLDAGADRFLRFPSRLFWGGLLCLAGLAALAASELERRSGTVVRLLLVLAVIEPFLIIRLPQRQLTRRSFVSTAYAEAPGPVLDLYPEGAAPPELDHLFTRLACFAQTRHGQAIADDCLSVDIQANPRYRIGQWVLARAMEGDGTRVAEVLGAAGFGAIAVHADLFSAGDRARLLAGLDAVDPEPVVRTDGGERLVLLRLDPAAEPRDPTPELDETPPARLRTAPLVEGADSLRVEVQGVDALGVEPGEPGYAFRIWDGDAIDRTLELRDDGLAPGDMPDDAAWIARWDSPLPPMLLAELIRRDGEESTVLWGGPIHLGAADERLSFRDLGNGTARPLAMAAAQLSPPANFWNGTVSTVGWSVFAVVAVFGTALLRRREESGGA